MEPISMFIGGMLFGGLVTYLVGEDEKQELRDTILDLERLAAEQQAKIQAAADEKRRDELKAFRLLLRFYAERMQRQVDSDEAVTMDRALRLHVTVVHLQQLANAGGDPQSMNEDDQRFVRLLHEVQKDGIRRSDLAWLTTYAAEQHPDAAASFLEERFLRQKLRNDAILKKLRGDLLGLSDTVRALRARAQVERDPRLAAEADLVAGRADRMEQEIEEREAQADDLSQNLVIVHRVARPGAALGAHDQRAYAIVQRLAGLDGDRQSALTDGEREFLERYRGLYEHETSRELEAHYGISAA